MKIMHYLPIAIQFKHRRVLVVGGGPVAERKTKSLLRAGAQVRLIAPVVTPGLKQLADRRVIKWIKRKVRKSDVGGVRIIVAATNDSKVNERLKIWSQQRKILINVVDKPNSSDFISLALLRKEKALIAVYTEGRDPVLSRDLKNYLKEKWDDFLLYRNRFKDNAT